MAENKVAPFFRTRCILYYIIHSGPEKNAQSLMHSLQ